MEYEMHTMLIFSDGMESSIYPKCGESLSELKQKYIGKWVQWGEEDYDKSRVIDVIELTHEEYKERRNR